MSRGLDCFHSGYVYRVLRPDEDPNSDLTCCAPRSVRTISQHVATGLKDPSRYISTTSSRDKALKWIETANEKSSFRYGNKRTVIVKIDVEYIKSNCPEIANSAYDLTNDLNRNIFLQTVKERKFSCAYNEVVFKDKIPSEAVSIEYIQGKGFVNNAGNLSATRTTNPIRYNTLSASTPNSLNPSNSASTDDTLQGMVAHLKKLGIDLSHLLDVPHSPTSSKSDLPDTEEIVVTPKAQLVTESTTEKYQLKNTISEHTKYKSTLPSDSFCQYRPNPFDIKKSEIIAVNPVDQSILKKPPITRSVPINPFGIKKSEIIAVKSVDQSILKKTPIIRSIPINSSIKSPEKHVNYKNSFTGADFVNEKNSLRRTLPNYSINLSPDNSTLLDSCDDDDAKRSFVAEIMPTATRKYQLESTKFNLPDSNDVKRTEIRSNLPQRIIIKSDNSPVKRTTTPLYEPIRPSYPRSLYSDNKAENNIAKVPEVKRVHKPISEMYSINRKIADSSKLKSIQRPAILPSYDDEQTFSVSKAKIPADTNVYKSFEEKPKLANTTTTYSPYHYLPSHISSSIADRSDTKSEIPVAPDVNTRAAKSDYDTYSFRERIISDVPKSGLLPPRSISSLYTRSSKASEVTKTVEPGLKMNQLRATIAGKSECQTIQSPLYHPYSIGYPSYGFSQKENSQ